MPDPSAPRVFARRFVVLLLVLGVLNTAGLAWLRQALIRTPNAGVSVFAALPRPGTPVDDVDRLSILFDQPVAAEEEIGAVVHDAPFIIRPAAPGHWIYATPERLDFVLAEPLTPGTTYTATPHPDAPERLGRALAGHPRYSWSTRRLEVRTCAIDTVEPDAVTIRLDFNQPVHPDDLVTALHRPTGSGVDVLTRATSAEHLMRVPRASATSIRLHLSEALHGARGHLGLAEPFKRTLSVPARFAQLDARAAAPGASATSTITLRFSQRLDPAQDLASVRVVPEPDDLHVEISRARLRLTGAYRPGARYTVHVPATLRGLDGEALGAARESALDIPPRASALRFAAGGGVLSTSGHRRLEVIASGLSRVHARSSRVYDNNLVAHARGAQTAVTSWTGPRHTLELPAPDVEGGVVRAALELDRFLEDGPGIYRVEIRGDDHSWRTRGRMLVEITDLAMTAKRGRGEIVALVTDVASAAPHADVEIEARSATNQVVARGTTGPDGLARLAVAEAHRDGVPWLLIARSGEDRCTLRLDRDARAYDDAITGGRANPTTYDIFLAPEREIARPGDPLRIIGIVRTADGIVPPSFPLEFTLRRPDGHVVERCTHATTDHGVLLVEFDTRDDDMTGRYTVSAAVPGSSTRLASSDVWIEAFVPARLAVTAQHTTSTGAHTTVDVRAAYLWGAPAAGLAATLSGTARPQQFVPPPDAEHLAGFVFESPKPTSIPLPRVTGQLDETGCATLAMTTDDTLAPGRYRLTLGATVTETGGPSVSASTSHVVDTADGHLGTRVAGDVLAGTPAAIEWCLVDAGGTDLARNVEVSVTRIEHDWVLREVRGRRAWTTLEREAVLEGDAAIVHPGDGGRFGTVSFVPPSAGDYRVVFRTSRKEAESDAGAVGAGCCERTLTLRARSGRGIRATRPEHPERVAIDLPPAPGPAGAPVPVTIRAPFAGTLLLTLESDVVHTALVTTIGDGAPATVVPLDVPPTVRGGAFVTATLIRAVDGAAERWLPHRASGRARLLVNHASARVDATLAAPDAARPRERIHMTLRAPDLAGDAMAVVWAVDDGIVRLTGAPTPDPHAHFFAARRHDVDTADRLLDLLPDHARLATLQRIGSDAARRSRRGPTPARRRPSFVVAPRLVPFPAGTSELDLDLEVPDMTGALRVYALVVNGDRYAGLEHTLRVAAPLMVEGSWPRALAPGDTAQIAARLTNTTESALRCRLDAACADAALAVRVRGAADAAVDVPARNTRIVWVDVEARGVGTAEVTLTGRADSDEGSLVHTARAPVLVRRAEPLAAVVEMHPVRAGTPLHLAPAPGFVVEGLRTTITVSPRPFVELRPALRGLIEYPHGCLEQTSSRTLALLAADRAIGAQDGDAATAARRAMIHAGLDRICSMGTTSGGLSYWPGGTTPDHWGTAYALLVLHAARDDGFAVADEPVRAAAAWLEEQDRDRAAPNLAALVARVHAARGAAPDARMAWLHERLTDLDPAGRGNLALAWLDAGRRDRARDVLTARGATPIPTHDGRITSVTRGDAVLLEAWTRLDADAPQAAELAARLTRTRGPSGRWYSTLDDASALWALARFQAVRPEPASYSGTLGAGTRSASFEQTAPVSLRIDDENPRVTIESEGHGIVYATRRTEGQRTPGTEIAGDEGLEVRRRWLDRSGNPIDPGAVRSGDLVVVEVSLRAGAAPVANVAVVDRLPGGFEVEHPRLMTSVGADLAQTHAAERVEFRDDRVLIFATAPANRTSTFRYALRAVTPGRFHVPTIEATCMYDTRLASFGVPERTAADDTFVVVAP